MASTYRITPATNRVNIQKDGGEIICPASARLDVHSLANTVSILLDKTPLHSIDVTVDTIILNGVTHVTGNNPYADGATAQNAITALFKEGNTGSAGSGLNADGTYSPNAATNYIKTASSLKNADELLDAVIKTNSDNIATNTSNTATNTSNIATNTSNIATNTSNIATNTSAITTTNTRTAYFLGAMTSTQRDAISSPTVGSFIFNTTTGFLEQYEDALWGWMAIGAPPAWQNIYGFDYFRTFYSTNVDAYLTAFTSSGSVSGNGGLTGFTAESAPSSNLNTQTTATGRAGWISSSAALLFGSGQTMVESRIMLPILSTSTERYVFFAGFSDNNGGIDPTDGAGLFYDEGGVSAGSTASANWQISVSSNNVRTGTVVATSIPVAANTWYTLRTFINAAGTAAKFYINGTLVNPSGTDITTNIPTGFARATGINTFISKAVGTTNRLAIVNAMRFRQKYTTPRS